MAFCMKCGAQMPDAADKCPNCESGQANIGVQYETAQSPMVQASQAVLSDSLAVIKKIMTSKPINAVELAKNAKTHVWIALTAIYLLLSAVAFMCLPTALISNVAKEALDYIKEYLPYGSLFVKGLILAAIFTVILFAGVMFIFSFYKHKVSFVTVMNIVSSSLLIASLSSVVAMIFSLFFAQASLWLLIFGILGSVILLYDGVKGAAEFKAPPFWMFLAVIAVDMIISSIVGKELVSSLVQEIASSFM